MSGSLPTQSETVWAAKVKAPQGGPTYVHNFEATTVSRLFSMMADMLDLEGAERVDITIVRRPA